MIQKRPPHRPRLVVRVGLTGHSLQDLPSDLSIQHLVREVGRTLQKVQQKATELGWVRKNVYENSPPKLRLIFAPVGGPEYLSAGEALDLGWDIQLLLPFPRESYRNIFLPDTPLYNPLATAFKEVIDKATEIMELDGSPTEFSSLERATQILLRQCDILIVIWTGGQGAIEQTVRNALSRDIPIVWIHPQLSHPTVLCEHGSGPDAPLQANNLEKLSERFETSFLLPKGDFTDRFLADFLADKHPQGIPLFRKFRDLVARGWNRDLPQKYRDETDAYDPWNSLDDPNCQVGSKIEARLRAHFNRADSMANAYGDLYRSLFLIIYGIGPMAALSVFSGIYLKNHNAFLIEFFLILASIILIYMGNNLHVHKRWVDYRLLGEGFRQMELLAPLARGIPELEASAYLDRVDPRGTWLNWYFRAVIREAGMISARIDDAFLETYRRVLASAVSSQIAYHTTSGRKMEIINKRLHWLAAWILFSTLVVCMLHLMPGAILEGWLSHFQLETVEFFLGLCAIVLPALGAAIEGIAHQGNFDHIDKRAHALRSRLEALHTDLMATERPMTSKELGRLAEYFCQIQILEQADWSGAFMSKPLPPP